MPDRNLIASFLKIQRATVDEGIYVQAAYLELPELREHIINHLIPDDEVPYYNKNWRLSKTMMSKDDQFLGGKIGFDKRDELPAAEYDNETHDFIDVNQVVTEGTYTYYVVHLDSGYVVVETNSDISAALAASVLTRFLNDESSNDRYEVNHVLDEPKFSVWLESVGGITEFSLAVTRPNPNYDGWIDELEEKLENTDADRLRIRLRTSGDRNLNSHSQLMSDYVGFSEGHREHGTFTARTAGGAVFDSRETGELVYKKSQRAPDHHECYRFLDAFSEG